MTDLEPAEPTHDVAGRAEFGVAAAIGLEPVTGHPMPLPAVALDDQPATSEEEVDPVTVYPPLKFSSREPEPDQHRAEHLLEFTVGRPHPQRPFVECSPQRPQAATTTGGVAIKRSAGGGWADQSGLREGREHRTDGFRSHRAKVEQRPQRPDGGHPDASPWPNLLLDECSMDYGSSTPRVTATVDDHVDHLPIEWRSPQHRGRAVRCNRTRPDRERHGEHPRDWGDRAPWESGNVGLSGCKKPGIEGPIPGRLAPTGRRGLLAGDQTVLAIREGVKGCRIHGAKECESDLGPADRGCVAVGQARAWTVGRLAPLLDVGRTDGSRRRNSLTVWFRSAGPDGQNIWTRPGAARPLHPTERPDDSTERPGRATGPSDRAERRDGARPGPYEA